MNPLSSFVVSQFTNPSGETVFRVSGWLYGKRVRKNFATRAEAEAERQVYEIGSLQIDGGPRAAITRLTDDQLREAESAFQRLIGLKQTLSSCIDFTLANYRDPAKEKRLVEAIAEYVASKKREHEQDQLSISQFSRIGRDLNLLKKHFSDVPVAELTVPRLVGFLENGQPGLKTYNNRRGIVSTFLKFAFVRGWIAENPITKVPQHRIRRRRGMAETLTAEQARTLMEHMETFEGGRWVPYFAICLFAGIRPSVPNGEIARLKPEAIDLAAAEISVSAKVSKIREPRKVAIQPNLAAWLRTYPLGKFPIDIGNFYQRRAKLGKEFGLTHDVMRHTFISMFVAKFRSIGEAAIQAGNSESIIRRHYLDLKSANEAEQFFGILPKRVGQFGTENASTLPHTVPIPLSIAV